MSKKILLISLSIALVAALIGGSTMAWWLDDDNAGDVVFTAGTVRIQAGGSMSVSNGIGDNCQVIVGTFYPAFVVDYDQGVRKNGTPVLASRSDPSAVLDFDDRFFSLGFKKDNSGFLAEGGWLTVKFECPVFAGNSFGVVGIIEETWGAYPEEKAAVYVSKDYVNWHYVGTASNKDNHDGTNAYSKFTVPDGLEWIQYVKVVDTTDPHIHGSDADGYDVNAIYVDNCLRCEVTNWNPGDCNEMNYFVKNVGSKSIYVRAILSGNWFEYNEDTGEWMLWVLNTTEFPDCEPDVVDLKPCNAMWVDGPDGYLYYTEEIGPSGTAELCLEVCLKGEETCNEFQGKRYVLTATFEAIQTTHGASDHEWGWSPPSP